MIAPYNQDFLSLIPIQGDNFGGSFFSNSIIGCSQVINESKNILKPPCPCKFNFLNFMNLFVFIKVEEQLCKKWSRI